MVKYVGKVSLLLKYYPMVGSRMFPLQPESMGYGCDQTLPQEMISKELFPQERPEHTNSDGSQCWLQSLDSLLGLER
ncbi:hypothetical protein GCM10025859_14880 [Alicyclobacillus fastidiosus]|nr:hypothetical protein GCM10025859_14880 [Alicyclobacillus fastidiosus]